MDYTVKEMSELSGFSESALRFYTEKGLLSCRRNGSNHRLFSEESAARLRTLKILKNCGMPLEDIRHYMEISSMERTPERVRQLYEIVMEQRREAQKQLERARETVALLEQKAAMYRRLLGDPEA